MNLLYPAGCPGTGPVQTFALESRESAWQFAHSHLQHHLESDKNNNKMS